MNALIVEDDPVCREYLQSMLEKWGYITAVTDRGDVALEKIHQGNLPDIAIIDRVLPDMDGAEICRKLRLANVPIPIYVILVTVKNQPEEIVSGLNLGADDYILKPFNIDELRARVGVGQRIVHFQKELLRRNRDLENAISQVKTLKGFIPICSYCKSIRNDESFWQRLETYIAEHSDAQFTHGVCPPCEKKYFGEK